MSTYIHINTHLEHIPRDAIPQQQTARRPRPLVRSREHTSLILLGVCSLHTTCRQCNTLQHTATHCNTPQHIATHRNIYIHAYTLHVVSATHWNTSVQHTTTPCTTLHHTASHCTTPHWYSWECAAYTPHVVSATHCNTLQHTATHCNTLQHTAPHCTTLQQANFHQKNVKIWRVSGIHCFRI